MLEKTMLVKDSSFRKLDDPFENTNSKKYVFYVKIDDVAEGIPMATNPRDQKLTSNVAKAITDSLESNDGYFHLKNRGIVISAKKVNYNNKTGKVTFIAYHGYSQVNYFCKSTGYFFDVYPNDVEINFKPYTYMTVNKYKVNISTTFNTSKKDKKVSFETKRKLRAYKSISDILHKESNNYEWTISKGVDVNIINLYMKDGKYYIKFRIWLDEYNGKPYNKYDYGYIKVGSTRLFKAVK